MNFVKLDIDFAVLFGPTRASTAKAATHWSQKYHYLKELYSDTTRQNVSIFY
jgi:hypothetical protein